MNVKVTPRVLERCLFLVKQLNSFTVMTHRRHGQQSRQDCGEFLLNLARYVIRGLLVSLSQI